MIVVTMKRGKAEVFTSVSVYAYICVGIIVVCECQLCYPVYRWCVLLVVPSCTTAEASFHGYVLFRLSRLGAHAELSAERATCFFQHAQISTRPMYSRRTDVGAHILLLTEHSVRGVGN